MATSLYCSHTSSPHFTFLLAPLSDIRAPNLTHTDGLVPALRYLTSETTRAAIIGLRHAVTPILANNILNHFTDHSVTHCDHVCDIVDSLIAPIQGTDKRLSEAELVVLYGSCYTHDLGMQYENAGSTNVIASLGRLQRWEERRGHSTRPLEITPSSDIGEAFVPQQDRHRRLSASY